MLLLSVVVGAVIGFAYTYSKRKLETDEEEYPEKAAKHIIEKKEKKANKHPEWPEWRQPYIKQDAYKKNDIVIYDDKAWISTVNYNTWTPDFWGGKWIQIK